MTRIDAAFRAAFTVLSWLFVAKALAWVAVGGMVVGSGEPRLGLACVGMAGLNALVAVVCRLRMLP